MCNEAIGLFRQIREEFPLAMWSGNWTWFEELRTTLEDHLSRTKPTARTTP